MLRKQTVIATIIGAGIVALAWVLVSLLGTGVPTVRGNLTVTYVIKTSPTGSSTSTVTGIAALEFHSGYVVMQDLKGDGQVFFPQSTQEFAWSR